MTPDKAQFDRACRRWLTHGYQRPVAYRVPRRDTWAGALLAGAILAVAFIALLWLIVVTGGV